MEMNKAVAAVLVMAVVTYIPRALPLVFYRRKIKSRWLRSFLYYVPYAVLGAMVFPSILYSTHNTVSAIVGFGVAITLAYLHKGLLQVATGSIIAVYICERIMDFL